MANYVKFRKGSLQAYQNLAPNYDDDTLYFIVDQDDNDGQLYLGSKLISGGEIGDFSIGDLQDAIIDNVGDKQILVYNGNLGAWVNTDYTDLVEEFIGATNNSAGVAGLVPAPGEGNTNLFLRSDGKWVAIEQSSGDIINVSGEYPISVDENGVISLAIDNKTLGIVDNSLSIKGFEDAEINAVLTKTENGLEWIVPEEGRDDEFAAAIEKLNGDVATIKNAVGQAAVKDEEGGVITSASGLYAEIEKLDSDISNVEQEISATNDLVSGIQEDISGINTAIDKIEKDIFERDKTLTQIQGDIQNLSAATTGLENSKANKSDVYTKSETDAAIEAAIAGVDHLKRKVVVSVESIDKTADDADLYIYMVPNSEGTYDEYMIIEGELEKVGDWKTDLSGYVTTDTLEQEISDLDAAINKKADIVYYPVKDEETGAVTQVPGSFLSPEDREKLSALVVGEGGNVEISGKVNADNVEGLDTWMTENANTYITGLTENNLGQSVLDKLNFITSVNESNFTVSNGKLNLVAVNKNQVTGLEDELNSKASSADVNLISTNVGNLNNILNGYTDTDGQPVEGLVSTVSNLSSKINSFEDNYVTKIVFNSTVGDLNALITTNKNNIDTLTSDVSILKEHLTWQNIGE